MLDPFGGSGVTAIEAYLQNRTGIQNDLNPLANFIARGIVELSKGRLMEYQEGLEILREKCGCELGKIQAMTAAGLDRLQARLRLPENIRLPRTSDVEWYHDLFTRRQLLALAVLKQAVDELPNYPVRRGMLLAWSATLAKLNRTFLSAEGRRESRGGSSVFSIYRFKVAKQPVELDPWPTFQERARNVLSAKIEIDREIEMRHRTGGWYGRFETHSKDIEELAVEMEGEIDYIFTDPPYGGHISYLDLSALWNCWLGMMPSIEAREQELIVGGDLNLEESQYIEKLGRAVRACMRMLKLGRWLSIVFQHWNTLYFETILTAAAEGGGELRAAVSQVGDPIWSMHKKKNRESVLAGEMIITFYKTGKPKRISQNRDFDLSRALSEILTGTAGQPVYGEYVFNRLIVEAWKNSAISSLNLSKEEFTGLLKRYGWCYDESRHYWVHGATPAQLLLH